MTTYKPGSSADHLHSPNLKDDSIALLDTAQPIIVLHSFHVVSWRLQSARQRFSYLQHSLTILLGKYFTLTLFMTSLAGFILLIQEKIPLTGVTAFKLMILHSLLFLHLLLGTPPLNLTNMNPPEPTQYIHPYYINIYHDNIIKNLDQHFNTSATDILVPHPFVAAHCNQYLYQYWQKNLFTTQLPTLSSAMQIATHDWQMTLCWSIDLPVINLWVYPAS